MAIDMLLAELDARGITLRHNGDRLRVEAPAGVLTDADRTAIAAHKPALLTILAYRAALHRVWELVAQGEHADHQECRQALDELVRRIDDAGEPAATRLRHRWEGEWWTATGRCPRCGEVGELHREPDEDRR